ncbi:MAG: hypothetical protein HC802_02910 [Caldilineaceae bacterium]|nr:hypothetical protein [Caldilineaceae bacterium]
MLGEEVVELATGLRYRPAIAFSAEPEYPSLLPGQSQTVYLRLHNQAKRTVEGALVIAPQQGLDADWQRRSFQLASDRHLSVPIQVTCTEPGAVALIVSASFDVDGVRVVATSEPLLLLSTALGGVSAGSTLEHGGAAGRAALVAENDLFQVVGRPSGGRCTVISKALHRRQARILEELGPPFEPWDIAEKQHRIAVRKDGGQATLLFTAESANFPGVSVTREITVTSSPLITVRHRVVNNGSQAYKFWIKPNVLLSDKEGAEVALPHCTQIIVEHGADFPSTHGDFPKKPDQMAEQWVALSEEGKLPVRSGPPKWSNTS